MVSVAVDFVRRLAEFVPTFAGEVLYDGPHSEAFVHGMTVRPHVTVRAAGDAFEGPLDCAVTYLDADDARHESRALALFSSSLSANGCGLLVGLPGTGVLALKELAQLLGSAGMTLYRHHGLSHADRPADESGYIAFVVRAAYNPLLHARDLMRAGHWEWAFELLVQVPEVLQHDPGVAAKIGAEKLVCLLAWDRIAGEKDRLARFFFAQATFYNAVFVAPWARELYLCQGEFWKRLGDPSMRTRLLRSGFYGAPEEERRQIEATFVEAGSVTRSFVPPDWSPPERLPRVLFVMHPRLHFGLDILYSGFCEVLGDANVVEYPYKPILHGAVPAELGHYPCVSNRRGAELPIERILEQLSRGLFDLVVYGDLEGHVDPSTARAILAAAGATPAVLLDAQDDPLNSWARMDEYVGGGMRLYFKREMLRCWDYGDHTVPLPFGYADDRVLPARERAKGTPLFWAGHRQYGLRRLYLEHIERKFGFDLNRNYTQDEYSAALSDARIGLNIFGFGFDTVRYWEIPAHGAMLLAERLPIHVPHDFVDGDSAVFFDDLEELEEKLLYWLERPEESALVAARGHDHLKRHHTASARARQLLGWVQARVPGWGRST